MSGFVKWEIIEDFLFGMSLLTVAADHLLMS